MTRILNKPQLGDRFYKLFVNESHRKIKVNPVDVIVLAYLEILAFAAFDGFDIAIVDVN